MLNLNEKANSIDVDVHSEDILVTHIMERESEGGGGSGKGLVKGSYSIPHTKCQRAIDALYRHPVCVYLILKREEVGKVERITNKCFFICLAAAAVAICRIQVRW